MIVEVNRNDLKTLEKFWDAVGGFSDPIHAHLIPSAPVRSLQANKYYFVVLNLIAQYTGHDVSYLHEYFKLLFNKEFEYIGPGQEIINFDDGGRLISRGKTTSDKSQSDFILYTHQIREWFNVFAASGRKEMIPEPHKISESLLLNCGIYY